MKQADMWQSGAWKKSFLFWGLVVLTCLVVAGVVAVVSSRTSPSNTIDSFQACKDAGGAIAESYPEQCFIRGKSYVNESQINRDGDYEGLTEQAALNKAKSASVPARVVERDGESLSVTMDYVVGRLNFHVKNGEVYKVDVEGQEE